MKRHYNKARDENVKLQRKVWMLQKRISRAEEYKKSTNLKKSQLSASFCTPVKEADHILRKSGISPRRAEAPPQFFTETSQ